MLIPKTTRITHTHHACQCTFGMRHAVASAMVCASRSEFPREDVCRFMNTVTQISSSPQKSHSLTFSLGGMEPIWSLTKMLYEQFKLWKNLENRFFTFNWGMCAKSIERFEIGLTEFDT